MRKLRIVILKLHKWLTRDQKEKKEAKPKKNSVFLQLYTSSRGTRKNRVQKWVITINIGVSWQSCFAVYECCDFGWTRLPFFLQGWDGLDGPHDDRRWSSWQMWTTRMWQWIVNHGSWNATEKWFWCITVFVFLESLDFMSVGTVNHCSLSLLVYLSLFLYIC